MSKPKFTSTVRRGLDWFMNQGYADYEVASTDDDDGRAHGLTAKKRKEIEAAYAWLMAVTNEQKRRDADNG